MYKSFFFFIEENLAGSKLYFAKAVAMKKNSFKALTPLTNAIKVISSSQ
jgi:hypothetical protein